MRRGERKPLQQLDAKAATIPNEIRAIWAELVKASKGDPTFPKNSIFVSDLFWRRAFFMWHQSYKELCICKLVFTNSNSTEN